MKQIKNKKGITLVALVITIIILLILAGVSINFIFGNEGIFNKTQYAVEKYQNEQEKENYILAQTQEMINNRETVMVDKEEYEVLKTTVENINSNFQSETGNIAIPSTAETTLKSFTNLSPGLYYISYTQCFVSGCHGEAGITINDKIISRNTCTNANWGSMNSNCSGVVEVKNLSDIIKLNYVCSGTTTTANRPYSWQIIKLK